MLADPAMPDEQAGRLVRERVGMARLIAARRPVEDREPRDHGHFDLLAARYKYLRTFTPAVIAALDADRQHRQPARRRPARCRRGIAGAQRRRARDRPGAGDDTRRDRVRAEPGGAATWMQPAGRAAVRPTGTTGS